VTGKPAGARPSLTAFLAARIDEAEAAANGLQFATRYPDKVPDFTCCGGPAAEVYWQHFDPARVLREVAAKRKIIEVYEAAAASNDPATDCSVGMATLRMVLRSYATVWSDHPHYRQEWIP
jgi:Family of unknown function (DUF6221)